MLRNCAFFQILQGAKQQCSHVYFFGRKNPTCTSLLGPTRLLILRIFLTCTFIQYYIFIRHVYFFCRKNPTCTSLLGPACLLILRIFPTWTFIQYYIFIRHSYFFWRKKPTCARLLGPASLLILSIFPTCMFIQQYIYKARLFFLEEKSHLHNLIRTCTFIDFKDFSHLHIYSGLHYYLVPQSTYFFCLYT